jgi:hypothetical protein
VEDGADYFRWRHIQKNALGVTRTYYYISPVFMFWWGRDDATNDIEEGHLVSRTGFQDIFFRGMA